MLAKLTASVAQHPRAALALAATFGAAAVLGAYADWVLWHSMDTLLVSMAATALLVGAVIAATIPRPFVRRTALFALVSALGLGVGQAVGPSRPELRQIPAEVTAALDRPGSATGEGQGSCDTGGESELQLVASLRLQVRPDDPSAPAELDQREFFTIALSVGDRWRDRAIHRSDNVDLAITVGTVVADEPEVRYAANDASLLELAWTVNSGSLRFDRLVIDPSPASASGASLDLAGTITWNCREGPLPEGAAEIAATACATSTFPRCVDDVLRMMREIPGSWVAVCEYSDATGAVIELERPADATGFCAGAGPDPRVIEVLRLPEE